jgi:hypothetical protein
MIEKAAMPRYDVFKTMRDQEIKSFVRKTVKETLRAELAHIRAKALLRVSREEMADIVKRHKKPTGQIARIVRIRWNGK